MNTCLSYQQLNDYALHRIIGTERDLLFMHISACELCAAAVNGFALVPFSSDELVAIHSRIDQKANPIFASPLTITQFWIVLISILSIAGIYKLSDRSTMQIPVFGSAAKSIVEKRSGTQQMNIVSRSEIHALTVKVKTILRSEQQKKFAERLMIPESLSPIRRDKEMLDKLLIPVASAKPVHLPQEQNITYLFDLKVSDYAALYRASEKPEPDINGHYVPVSLENKNGASMESDLNLNNEPVEKLIRSGLRNFNKGNFQTALGKFNQLLEHNKTDVNAQFYSGMCYLNSGNFRKALDRLVEARENGNQSFESEATWQLALLYDRFGDRQTARSYFQELVDQQGFYALRAKEKLN